MDFIAPVVAGFFAMTSAVLVWRLKRVCDEKDRKAAVEKEQMDTIKSLYTEVIEIFDSAFKEISSHKEFTLSERFSKTGAKLHIFAQPSIIELYDAACSLLDSWTVLHAKATPPRREVDGNVITILQAPDPTLKFKKPAEDEFAKLQGCLRLLKEAMRSHVAPLAGSNLSKGKQCGDTRKR